MKTLVCVSESVYVGQLTRGTQYEALEIDDGARQYRVLNDEGRFRWYPAACFGSGQESASRLATFRLDDTVQEPSCDLVDVSFDLSDGSRRWCTFTTPAYLASHGDLIAVQDKAIRATFGAPHVIIITEISEAIIAALLELLDREGILIDCSLPL